MRSLLGLAFLSCLLWGSACKKPDIDDCRRVCWNYNKMMFWQQVDEKVKGLSPEESAKIRAQSEIEFAKIAEREEDPGLMNCITRCQHDLNKSQVACMLEAKTPESFKSCDK